MFEDYEKYEEEFRKLDRKEYVFLGSQLRLFFEAMKEVGFNDRDAFELVASHQKFIYDMGVEEFIQTRTEKMLQELEDEEGGEDDVDFDNDIS